MLGPLREPQSRSALLRQRGRIGLLILLGSLLAVDGAFAAEPLPSEVRALWVVRTALVSPDEVDRVVDRAAAAGFNTLLVQVRGRGDAFYDSRIVVRSVLIARQPPEFDPLARLLERAKARGLAVHGWVNVLLTAHFGQPLPPTHVLARHPEWMMVPRRAAAAALRSKPSQLQALVENAARAEPDIEGLYLSPASPQVTAHLTQVVRELVLRYALDGLHLDFVRYPGVDYDYSRSALESFRLVEGGKADLLSLAVRNPSGFAEHRRVVLTGLVDRLSKTARQARPDLVVSAAVVPVETEALVIKGQSWGEWLDRGLIDVVCPMAYAVEERAFGAQVEQALARGAGRPVWLGIGAWRLSLETVARRVRTARAAGAAGVALFSHESMGDADAQRMRSEVFGPGQGAPSTGAALGMR